MTAPEKPVSAPVQGVAGAPRRLSRDEIVSERNRLLVQDRKAMTEMMARISELNWGKGLSPDMRRVMGSYCRRNGLDPREINILGGNIYRNSKYWLRRLSELVQDNHVDYVMIDHIAHDRRLEEDAKNVDLPPAVRNSAIDEMLHRRELRIKYRVPEESASACLCRVKVKWMPQEVVGCKFIVIGRQKKKSDGTLVTADPIGEEFPTETVESRALRRALRLVASTNPALKAIEEELKDEDLVAGAQLVEVAASEAAREQAVDEMSPPKQLMEPAVQVFTTRAPEREKVPVEDEHSQGGLEGAYDRAAPPPPEPPELRRPPGAAPVSPRDG